MAKQASLALEEPLRGLEAAARWGGRLAKISKIQGAAMAKIFAAWAPKPPGIGIYIRKGALAGLAGWGAASAMLRASAQASSMARTCAPSRPL